MIESGVTYHKLSKSQANRAGTPAVRSWQWRQEPRLAPRREKGCIVGVFDVAFAGMDGGMGRMWIRRGCKAVLPGGRSRQVVALHGIYFEDNRHIVREYARADSRTLIDFLEEVTAKVPRMVLYVDRSSIHSSAEIRRFLREFRKAHPDRDVRLFLLPRGSPYLSVIEEFWNLLKDAVTKRYRYRTFNALRWAVMDYVRTTRVKLDLYRFLYRSPEVTRRRPRRPDAPPSRANGTLDGGGGGGGAAAHSGPSTRRPLPRRASERNQRRTPRNGALRKVHSKARRTAQEKPARPLACQCP